MLARSSGAHRNASGMAVKSLRGFTRVDQLAPGASRDVDFRLTTRDFMVVPPDGSAFRVLQGEWLLMVCCFVWVFGGV